MQRKDDPQGLFAIGILLAIVPLAITAIWWSNFRGYFMNPASFATVTGTVLDSSMSYHGGKNPGYNFYARYTYAVNGKSYTSNRVTFGVWGSSKREWAEAYLSKYPAGRPVTVYFKPNEPSFSVLEPANKQGTLGSLLFTVGFYVVSFWFIFAGLKGKRRTARPS